MGHSTVTNRDTGCSRDFVDEIEARYRNVLIRYFTRKLNDPHEAEDCAQEVLARLIASDNQKIKNPDAYVFQIAGNLSRDHYRRRAVREKYLKDHCHTPDLGIERINPEQIVENRIEFENLLANLKSLPKTTRVVFVLSRFENLKIQTIADRLSISPSTVKNHLSRALMRLTEGMECEGD